MRIVFALALASLAIAPALAQKPHPTPSPSPSVIEEPPPPYETKMLRLAEIMGALAALRDLCGAGDGADYRAKFAALMDAEANTPARKGAWAGAFNESFDDYRLTYAQCTPRAETAIVSFLNEANRIASEVADEYAR